MSGVISQATISYSLREATCLPCISSNPLMSGLPIQLLKVESTTYSRVYTFKHNHKNAYLGDAGRRGKEVPD